MGYYFIFCSCLYFIVALIISYLFIYPMPKNMVINLIKKKSTRVNLRTNTSFIVFMTSWFLIIAITLYKRDIISSLEWYALVSVIPLLLVVLIGIYLYQQKIHKKISHLIHSTTEMSFVRKKEQTNSIVYIIFVLVTIAIIVFNLYASFLKNPDIFIEDMVNIGVIGFVMFVYLFYLFGLLDTFTELSNLENVKLERASEIVEGLVFLETKNDMFIKQVNNGEVVIVNKNLTEVISFKNK